MNTSRSTPYLRGVPRLPAAGLGLDACAHTDLAVPLCRYAGRRR
jgi:hypothetical protein